MDYLFHILIYLNIYVVIALSLNMVVGYLGLLNLAQAGYVALGGYTYALITIKLGWDFLPALLAGIAVGSILSFLLSIPSWRFKGDFFMLLSLTVQALLFSLFNNWWHPSVPPGTWKNLTNGPLGITGIPKPVWGGMKAEGTAAIFLVTLIITGICLGISWRLLNSPWGRLLEAIRDDELAARGLGKTVQSTKVWTFAISGGMGAAAGVMYAAYVNFIDPGAASLDEAILILCMVLIGGSGNFRGPIVGALLLLLIPELLRLLQFSESTAANLRLMIYGILLVVIVHFRPQGIAGKFRLQ